MLQRSVNFLGEVKAELQKVVFPSREKTIKLTILVIILSLLTGAFIGSLDIIFAKLFEVILKKRL